MGISWNSVRPLALLAWCGGCAGPPAELSALNVEVDLEPIVRDQEGWNARGTFSLAATTQDEGGANQLVVTRLDLAICTPELEATFGTGESDAQFSFEPQQSMPLALPDGETTTGRFTFEMNQRVPVMFPPGWQSWCAVRAPACEAGIATFTVAVADRRSSGRTVEGEPGFQVVSRDITPTIIDEREGLLPPAQEVGARWSRLDVAPFSSTDSSIAVDAQGRIFIVTEDMASTGHVVIALDDQGAERWRSAIGVMETAPRLLVRGDRVVLVHSFRGTGTFLGQAVQAQGGEDLVVAALSTADGSVERLSVYASPGRQELVDAVTTPDGGLIVLVRDEEGVDWGGGAMVEGKAVVRWDASGTFVSSFVTSPVDSPSTPPFDATRVAVDGTDRVVVAGALSNPWDFGNGIVEPADGASSVGVARYDAMGGLLTASSLPRAGSVVGLVTDADGFVHLATRAYLGRLDEAGGFVDVVDFDEALLPNLTRSIFAVDGLGRPMLSTRTGYGIVRTGQLREVQLTCDATFIIASGSTGEVGLFGSFRGVFSADQGPLEPEGREGIIGAAISGSTP